MDQPSQGALMSRKGLLTTREDEGSVLQEMERMEEKKE